MIDRQMELSLAQARSGGPQNHHQRRLSRAQWWFERMRETVERAFDWRPAPLPRPEQIWLPNAQRPGSAESSTFLESAGRNRRRQESQRCE